MATGLSDCVGRVVAGRYRLLELIGVGGMSAVFLARDATLNKQWAVKMLKPCPDERVARRSFLTEASMIKRFDHPAIPRVVDYLEEEGRPCVVMDYVEGRTLADRLRSEGAQTEGAVADWALQMCDVLEYLHRRKPPVVYRDLKPSNVIVTSEGRVRLVDFGIAMEQGARHVRGVGTPGFGAPEQFDDPAGVDARADVYSLGATMYALLTGRHPTDHARHRLECSPAMERIVRRCLDPDPESRFLSCAEVAYALTHRDDGMMRARMRRRRTAFRSMAAGTALCCALSPACVAMGAWERDRDYEHWVSLARTSVDSGQAADFYHRAIEIQPRIEAYEGLVELDKADSVLDAGEERDLTELIARHSNALRQDPSWPRLCYDMGILYWHYYEPGKTDGYADSFAAIAAAEPWMREAAEADGFAQSRRARIYAGIAEFQSHVVAAMNEGTDAGRYAPYFDSLCELVALSAQDANSVLSVQAASLSLSALRVYPRHFRADGVARARMERLADDSEALARSAEPATPRDSARRDAALADADDARRAVASAFVDAGVGEEAGR